MHRATGEKATRYNHVPSSLHGIPDKARGLGARVTASFPVLIAMVLL